MRLRCASFPGSLVSSHMHQHPHHLAAPHFQLLPRTLTLMQLPQTPDHRETDDIRDARDPAGPSPFHFSVYLSVLNTYPPVMVRTGQRSHQRSVSILSMFTGEFSLQ